MSSPGYEPQSGELFADRYRIERLLGRGAAGAVWAVLDEEVGDRVALKLLTSGPDDAAERFRREVRLARRVTHKNAARIFDLGTAGGVLYLTMELVEGESLLDVLSRSSPLSVTSAVEIACQIANGLSAAHDVDVVHRDIKPANVLVESTGRVVLTDFGLARAMVGDVKVTIGAATSSLDQPMVTVPIFGNIAPVISVEPPIVLLRQDGKAIGTKRMLKLQGPVREILKGNAGLVTSTIARVSSLAPKQISRPW